MMTYKPLWKTMIEKNLRQVDLYRNYGFSSGQMSRIREGKYVSTETINRLCEILECNIEDIIQFEPDDLPKYC